MSNPNAGSARPLLRLATRGSPLALAQAHLTRNALALAHGWESRELDKLCPIVTFRTMGDRIQDRPLVEAGGKGLFVKEIEEALLADEADIAVHSMKDMPAVLPERLTLAAILPRENPADLFISADGANFSALKGDARLGTSSVRRQAQALRRKPDLKIVSLRGNVETRLAKLSKGEADAIMLARAGIARLGLSIPNAEILETESWLPALCQGAVGIEIRNDDRRVQALIAAIDDAPSHLAISCERGFLAALDGSCRTPLAGLARITGSKLEFRGEALTLDGRDSWAANRMLALNSLSQDAAREAACRMGHDAAHEIRQAAGARLPLF